MLIGCCKSLFSMIFVILNLILQVSDCSKFSVVTIFKYIDRISPLSHPSVFISWSFIKTLQKLFINLIVRSKLLTDSKYEFCLDHVRLINYSQYTFIYLPVAFSFCLSVIICWCYCYRRSYKKHSWSQGNGN